MLDKKALRKFAADNPAPAIPPWHGLLHAPQVDYIVRTAVKIINRRRTLILYIYSCGKAVTGNLTPVWTMFQAGSDYITLARRKMAPPVGGRPCSRTWTETTFSPANAPSIPPRTSSAYAASSMTASTVAWPRWSAPSRPSWTSVCKNVCASGERGPGPYFRPASPSQGPGTLAAP